MKIVFLSHSFAEEDRNFAFQVERLIRSHGLVVCTGKNLAGRSLSAEVTKLIESSDGLIALCTERARNPVASTHPWVLQEYAIARAAALRDPTKQALSVWQTGIAVQGIDTGFEHVDYDPPRPADAFLRLSEILGEWKQRAGRLLKVQLMPEDIARQIGRSSDRVQCLYRWQANGQEAEWIAGRVRREVGGIFGYLRVPDTAEMIQVRATGPDVNCESPYTPVRMFVQMDSVI